MVISMNIWHDIDKKRIGKDKFVAYIEIQSGCKNKYELDKDTGLIRLDRILYTATHYPANYGFIPRTYCDDNDPLDVLVVSSEPIIPTALVDCKPIGVIKMEDQGSNDEKIIAVCLSDPFYSNVDSINDLPPHIVDEFEHFFLVYKTLENKETSITTIEGKEEAKKIIEESIEKYNKKFNR